MIALFIALITLLENSVSIDARTLVHSSARDKDFHWHGNIQKHQRVCQLSFIVCLPQSLTHSYINAMDSEELIERSNVAVHPTFGTKKSSLVLGFWSSRENNEFDGTSGSDVSNSDPILRVDYKHSNDEVENENGNNLALPEKPERGMVLYNASQTVVDGVNETLNSINITRSTKRSRLASLRRLRPLIVPPWLLPFLSSNQGDINLDRIGDGMTDNSTSSLMLPSIDTTNRSDVFSLLFYDENVVDAEIEDAVTDAMLSLEEEQNLRSNGIRNRLFRRYRRKNSSFTSDIQDEATVDTMISILGDETNVTLNPINVSNESSLQIKHYEHVTEAEIIEDLQDSVPDENTLSDKDQSENRTRRSFFFRHKGHRHSKSKFNKRNKEEAKCPAIVSDIHELREAVLVNKIPLSNIGFRFPVAGIGSEVLHSPEAHGNITAKTGISLYNKSTQTQQDPGPNKVESVFQRYDPVINGTLSSLLTSATGTSTNRNTTQYNYAIELLSNHPVLSLVHERVKANSTPGNRQPSEPHLALVIEGGGMRGAVSAGMAAALSTLDLLDAFDSVHGSSAGAIIGAYVVSRQLCTDVYTDIMPAAGSRFASKKRSIINFGVDWLAELVSISESSEEDESTDANDSDEVCELVDDLVTSQSYSNSSMWICEDDVPISSVELAMGKITNAPRRRIPWADDHYDGLVLESMEYLMSRTQSIAKKTIKPLSVGMKYLGMASRPALDFAASMGQYLRRKPGMNLTYVLDGIMNETHGLRPFDMQAFKANDKKQPLYVIASAVSNGGSGEMETLAFNSADGDFFGVEHDLVNDSKSKEDQHQSWYGRVWSVLKQATSALYSAVYNVMFSDAMDYSETILPPGTNAIGGLVNEIKQIPIPKKDKENVYGPTEKINNEGGIGLFPCLEASMLVPGIGNPPVSLIRSINRKFIESNRRLPRFIPRRQGVSFLDKQKKEHSHLCYDAFCYEPIPYRSAVEKAGATHVLALRSRPDGCVVETKQHLYERSIGPTYFRKHGMNNVAKLFSSGGSQYRYIEDVLTLNEGLTHGVAVGCNSTSSFHPRGVKVPPTKLLFGTEKMEEVSTEDWKRAHLLPITLPIGSSELPTLSQDRDEVLKAVRSGYAAAFDILSPIAGLPFDSKAIPGDRVAEILFPGGDDDIDDVLNKPMKIKPSYIGTPESGEVIKELRKRERFAAWVTGKRKAKRRSQEKIVLHPQGTLAKMIQFQSPEYHESDQYVRDESNTLEWLETEALLAALPGFRNGKLDHIADMLLAKEERKKES